ncbi:hypothetical protein [Tsukamurella sp. PLM1]|uniref:hypothetical protein n=1 Tax=Tsukamurella sp. PLM1 TaxID=2929795 RepID=UPI0020524272|nr:hypothetical protein MTP03_36350 [Tsukamurella sp. PLM1]
MTRRVMAVLLAVLLVVSGCATIPESTSPRVIGNLGGEPARDQDIVPRRDAGPELIVRDFLKANALADGNHAASRKFLLQNANWQVPKQAVVVKDIDVLPTERSANFIKATIRAQATGFFGADGTFSPASQSITQNVQLVQVDGQWRIQGLSSVGDTPMLVIDTEQFRSVYRRYLLYFPDPTGRTLVPDARWLASPRSKLAADLLMLLVRGLGPTSRTRCSTRSAPAPLCAGRSPMRRASSATRASASPGCGWTSRGCRGSSPTPRN